MLPGEVREASGFLCGIRPSVVVWVEDIDFDLVAFPPLDAVKATRSTHGLVAQERDGGGFDSDPPTPRLPDGRGRQRNSVARDERVVMAETILVTIKNGAPR